MESWLRWSASQPSASDSRPLLQAAGSLFVVPCVLLKGRRQAGRLPEENLFLDETDRKKKKDRGNGYCRKFYSMCNYCIRYHV